MTTKKEGSIFLKLNKSEDAWEYNIDEVEIHLTSYVKKCLIEAMEQCIVHNWYSVLLWYDETGIYTENNVSDDNYFPGAEYFKVKKDYITFHSEHKHNSQCFFESEEFIIENE